MMISSVSCEAANYLDRLGAKRVTLRSSINSFIAVKFIFLRFCIEL